jgi:hypothetical protein
MEEESEKPRYSKVSQQKKGEDIFILFSSRSYFRAITREKLYVDDLFGKI